MSKMDEMLLYILFAFAFLLIIQTAAILGMNGKLGNLAKQLANLSSWKQEPISKKPTRIKKEDMMKAYLKEHPELKDEPVEIEDEETKEAKDLEKKIFH